MYPAVFPHLRQGIRLCFEATRNDFLRRLFTALAGRTKGLRGRDFGNDVHLNASFSNADVYR